MTNIEQQIAGLEAQIASIEANPSVVADPRLSVLYDQVARLQSILDVDRVAR
jgi:hypothetical protein